MPELPEVETVKNTLKEKIIGLRIIEIKIYLPKIIRFLSPEEFKNQIKDKRITYLDRRGKYLLIYLTGNMTLVIHLRMTGRLVFLPSTLPAKHTHVVFTLENNYEVHFTDMRQFGRIIASPTNELHNVPGLKDLGIEPLGDDFSQNFLRRELKRRRIKIKNLLLDQSFIAGLGNIYVDEALHRARLNPMRTANTLAPREITRLYQAILEVLREGIYYGGTTFRDYVDGSGKSGNYQEFLNVYGKEGSPCTHCKTEIERIKISGRSSYYCPFCQKM